MIHAHSVSPLSCHFFALFLSLPLFWFTLRRLKRALWKHRLHSVHPFTLVFWTNRFVWCWLTVDFYWPLDMRHSLETDISTITRDNQPSQRQQTGTRTVKGRRNFVHCWVIFFLCSQSATTMAYFLFRVYSFSPRRPVHGVSWSYGNVEVWRATW